MQKVLVIEDDEQIRNQLKDFLVHAGYAVVTEERGDEAMGVFTREKPDLVVLDLNLPGKDGIEVCRDIRVTSRVPLIMLTARREEADQVKGLREGADDYIVKPFSPRVLVLKVQKMFERPPLYEPEVVKFADLVLNISQRSVSIQRGHAAKAVHIPTTPAEFNLLLTLVRNPRKAFSRDELIDSLSDESIPPDIFDRTIDSHVKNLRKKLGSGTYIETVRGVGYKAVIPGKD
ncbi:hypothetical protein AUK40_03110 [Candidatus Wirthbacteria bacterium CG2_30_54_11]|uniref:DNA-binding response regulator n=1 Tax=Candidatus Wirthbacteria bacterium CG2_30_54_11 TaxID=1817892 RepID=A0A1J5IL75_9BACT|nr:MAG: hypothetical protein AUK40_03110 [Candidatus Wirthbacteria bacterium CG2_30_54_11]